MQQFFLSNVLDEKTMKKLSKSDITAIEESVNGNVQKISETITEAQEKRFDKMVNDLTEKFESEVSNAVNECVQNQVGGKINEKLLNVVKQIANLLESAGIHTTEETKKLAKRIQEVNDKLKSVYEERDKLLLEADKAKKNEFIYSNLRGMNPSLIDAVIKHYENVPFGEIDEEELQAIVNNPDILATLAEIGANEYDPEMEKIEDVVNAISNDNKTMIPGVPLDKNGSKMESAGEKEAPENFFESRGVSDSLRKMRAFGGKYRNPNVSNEDLMKTITLTEDINAGVVPDNGISDADVENAVKKLGEFVTWGSDAGESWENNSR